MLVFSRRRTLFSLVSFPKVTRVKYAFDTDAKFLRVPLTNIITFTISFFEHYFRYTTRVIIFFLSLSLSLSHTHTHTPNDSYWLRR